MQYVAQCTTGRPARSSKPSQSVVQPSQSGSPHVYPEHHSRQPLEETNGAALTSSSSEANRILGNAMSHRSAPLTTRARRARPIVGLPSTAHTGFFPPNLSCYNGVGYVSLRASPISFVFLPRTRYRVELYSTYPDARVMSISPPSSHSNPGGPVCSDATRAGLFVSWVQWSVMGYVDFAQFCLRSIEQTKLCPPRSGTTCTAPSAQHTGRVCMTVHISCSISSAVVPQ